MSETLKAPAEQSHTVIVKVVGKFEIPMSELIEWATRDDGDIVSNGDALREAVEFVDDNYTLADGTWELEIDEIGQKFTIAEIRPQYVPTKWDEAMGSIISSSISRHRK